MPESNPGNGGNNNGGGGKWRMPTDAGGAYKREDGVYVAPINLLKP